MGRGPHAGQAFIARLLMKQIMLRGRQYALQHLHVSSRDWKEIFAALKERTNQSYVTLAGTAPILERGSSVPKDFIALVAQQNRSNANFGVFVL